jgi:hypothetical protein
VRDTSRVITTRLPETCIGRRRGLERLAPRAAGHLPGLSGGRAQASSDRLGPGPGMGKEEEAKSPMAARLEATGELNTPAVVNSPGTLAGIGRRGISPP